MEILLIEFVTGGGWQRWFPGEPLPGGSLRREGQAMLAAVATDLARIAGCRLHVMRDTRLAATLPLAGCQVHDVADACQFDTCVQRLAGRVDWCLPIAPELGGALTEVASLLRAAGGRVLLPDEQALRTASDKHATALALAAAGVPVPDGRALAAGDPLPLDAMYPLVVKPRDGAGSEDVRLVASAVAARGVHVERPSRCEVYCPGMAASVSCLAGPAGSTLLPACRQRLSDDGRFVYLGGRHPLPQAEAERAARLAAAAIEVLRPGGGWLGVDLVLGADPAGGADRVIEVNPRLTTSYVGLRAACPANLAAALVAAAEGARPELSFRPEAIEFDADGRVRHLAGALD